MAKVIALPSNVEAERAVLGAMMMDKSALAIGVSSLTEDSFSEVDPRNRLVFRAIHELTDRHNPVDPQTVTDELINLKLDKDSGAPDYLMTLVDSSISPDNVDHYIKIVKQQAVLRNFLLTMKKIQDEYNQGGIADIDDFLMKANQEISTVASSRSVGDFKEAKDVAEGVRVKLNQVSSASADGVTGVTTGYRRLNLLTHGWQKEDLIIVAARPSMGKTALAMNFAFNAASRGNVPVAFFSLEMNDTLIMERLIANRACVSNDKLQTGILGASERLKIASAIDEIGKTQLFFDDTPNSMLGDIIAKSTKLKAAHPDLGLIVIDYLGRIRTTADGQVDSRQQEVSFISGSLKTMARQLHCPVIVVCQLNRNVEDTETKVPMLSNLRESGSIEQDADQVLLLYRKDYYASVGQKVPERKSWASDKKYGQQPQQQQAPMPNPNGPKAPEPEDKSGNPSVMKILVAKNRNGQTGEFSLIFSKSYSRFDDPTEAFEAAEAQYEQETGGGFGGE
ncbi:MAG: Replicative DNA helicase [Tenericutes bacterium ADurb.BinA155]|jgi:replicative DNA helicase|nr:MAG: Replicative DNA helicase [Tenericutes bacterium ADurb.BinA155]